MYFTSDLSRELVTKDMERSNLKARLSCISDEYTRERICQQITRLDQEIERLDALMMYEVCYGF